MQKDLQEIIDKIIKSLPELTRGQILWIQEVINSFKSEHNFNIFESGIINENILRDFGYALLIHHTFSDEPFSKDKFEYVLVTILKIHDIQATMAPKGNPGNDIFIGETKVSLKTQANKNIKEDQLWISKFMELGKGTWSDNPLDLDALRIQFLNHLNNYERILVLRTISKKPNWHYELVEIPLDLLREAGTGELEMKLDSKQFPKPGYCYVRDSNGNLKYQLYFDGGSERKLQVKRLSKKHCKVHCEWKFTIN